MKKIVSFIIIVFFATGLYAELFEKQEIDQRFEPDQSQVLSVFLNIDIGELDIQPAEDSQVGIINILHEKEAFLTDIDFDKRKNQLKIKVDNDNWFHFNTNEHHDNNVPEITLTLPVDVEMNLDVRIKAGEVNMQLGGLSIKNLNVSSWAGETLIDFDTLNAIEMEMMRISPRIGECRLQHLGNSKFYRAKIDGGIGELSVDFSGGLLPESRAKVDLDIGEANIDLSEKVGVQIYIGGMSFLSSKNVDRAFKRQGRIYTTENFDNAAQKFYLKISPGLGELNVNLR